MKILLLAQFLPPVSGGEERHVWNLARALASRSHDVTLLGFATDAEAAGETIAGGCAASCECAPPLPGCRSSTATRSDRTPCHCPTRSSAAPSARNCRPTGSTWCTPTTGSSTAPWARSPAPGCRWS